MDTKKHDLLEACKNLVQADRTKMGRGAVRLRLELAKNAIARTEEPRTEKEAYYFSLAKTRWHDEGTIEIDDDAEVSISEDQEGIKGAYVQAWVWVE